MKNNSKVLLPLVGLLLLISCFNYKSMATYKQMPKVRTLEDFEKNYGETVKLFGILVNKPLKNKEVVVAESVFYIKLSDGMLILLPTKGDADIMHDSMKKMVGVETFVVGEPFPPGFPVIYEGLKIHSFNPIGFITAMDDEMLISPQILDLEKLITYKEIMKGSDDFFAYMVGTTTQKIDTNAVFPQTTTILLQDKTPIEVTINEKSDIDILGNKEEKVFFKGLVNTNFDQHSVIDGNISNYEKYMDYYSPQ